MTGYRFQEIVLALLCFAWSLWLLIFDSYHTSPNLQALRDSHAPQFLLVLIPIICGMALLFFARYYRKPAHLIMALFWFCIAITVIQTNIQVTVIPVYIAISILHAGNYLSVSSRNDE